MTPAVAAAAFPTLESEPASALVVRNLDEAPRGSCTPAIEPPSSAKPPGISRLRNPWESRSDEDDLVDEALAKCRLNHELATEEEAVLSMLGSMSQQSTSGHENSSADRSRPRAKSMHSSSSAHRLRASRPELAPSPASQYSIAFKSPTPSEASQFSQASGASSSGRASPPPPPPQGNSVRNAVKEREELDRAASTASGAASASGSASGTTTSWLARSSALRKKASSYFSAVGLDIGKKGEDDDNIGDSDTQEKDKVETAPKNGSEAEAASASTASGAAEASTSAQQLRPPLFSRQTTSAAHYERRGPSSAESVGGSGSGPSPASRGSIFAQMQQQDPQQQLPSRLEMKRPSMMHRGSEFSTSSSIGGGGGLYARTANSSRRLLSPTSPIDGSLISSQGNATSLWSRPTHVPDTPNTSHDPRSPNQASALSRWNSNSNGKFGSAAAPASAMRTGYSLDAGSGAGDSSFMFQPKLRRQTTDWTDATSVTSGGGGDDDDVMDTEAQVTLTATAPAETAASRDPTTSTAVADERGDGTGSDVASGLSRRNASRSESSCIGSAVACKSVLSDAGSTSLSEVAPASVSSRQSRQSASVSVLPLALDSAAPLSPMPSSPTKAKDLIRFFETAGTATSPLDSPKRASDTPSPSKVSLRSVKKAFAESGNDLDALQVTPTRRLVFPLGCSNSNPNTISTRDSSFGAPTSSQVSPLTAKLRAGGVAGRSRLRTRMGGLVSAGGGGGMDGGHDDADPSDEENEAPSLEMTPVRAGGAAARRRLSGSSTTGRIPSGSRPPLASAFFAFGGQSAHGRSGSTPAPITSTSSLSASVGSRAFGGGLGGGPSYRASMDQARDSPSRNTGSTSTGAGEGKKAGGSGGGSGFPFRSSVRNLVNAFAGRGASDERGSSRSGGNGNSNGNSNIGKPKTLKKATSTCWDYTKEPWEAQQAASGPATGAEDEEADERDDNLSVASRMTLGTVASFKHKLERGDLPASAASAVELLGEPSSTPPVRSGILFYFNVHHREPHWQRVQVVLLPSAVAMSWIPAGGGRENVVLDLRACREVHSVPGPDHPSSTSDVGASCARRQGLGRLSPFQLIFDDGVERLAAESATERVKWVDSIWGVTGSPKDRAVNADMLAETRQRPSQTDLSELRWSTQQQQQPSSSSSARQQQQQQQEETTASPSRWAPKDLTHGRHSDAEGSSALPNTLASGQTASIASPRRPLPASRSTNTVADAINRIGSIWKSELSSDLETRADGQPSIAEALATGPPVPPKEPAATTADPKPALTPIATTTSSVLGRRQKVRSWRKKPEDVDTPAAAAREGEEGFVHDSAAKTPTLVQPPELAIRSQPASFADDRSENRTLAGSEASPRKSTHDTASHEMIDARQEPPDTAATSRPRPWSRTTLSRRSKDDDAISSRAAQLDAPPEDATQIEGAVSPAGTSPDLDGYESAHSHSSQIDEFGPRTPVSEAVFNWSRPKQDGEIRPSDSASQRPARSEFGTITSRVSVEGRPHAAGEAPTANATTMTRGAPVLTEARLRTVDDADDRTPAQRIRDRVLSGRGPALTEKNDDDELAAADAGSCDTKLRQQPQQQQPQQQQQGALPNRLGTVIEETQSQAQSTRASRQRGDQTPVLPQTRDSSEVDEVIASSEVIRQSLKSPAGGSHVSRRTESTSYTQDVYRLLEHLEDQQRAHIEREKLMEDQIRGFQDVIAGLQTAKSASGSVRSKRTNNTSERRRSSAASTSGESRSTNRTQRDSELAAMQEKLDSLHSLVADMVTSQSQQRNVPSQSGGGEASPVPEQSQSELARIESMLHKLMVRHAASTPDLASLNNAATRSRSIVRDTVLAREPGLVHEWDQLPPELRGAELMRSMEERARYGHDGRHEAIAQDMSLQRQHRQHLRQGSAPPMSEDCGTYHPQQQTPRAHDDLNTPRPGDYDGAHDPHLRAPSRASMVGSSVSMSDLDSVCGRVPARSWISADGIPSPPPNSEWDVGSIRSKRLFSSPIAGGLGAGTPAQNVRIHGDPSMGATMPTPRPALGPTQPSAGSLDMEAEIRRRRARQPGSAQPGGWYTSKVLVSGDGDAIAEVGKVEGGAAAAAPPGAKDRGAVGAGTPSVRWAPGGPARDPARRKAVGEDTPSGLGLSLAARNTKSGTFEGQCSNVGTGGGSNGDGLRARHPGPLDVRSLAVSSGNPELATILEALKQSEAARELQVRQQSELARYVNELHGWLEKDVAERSKEFRILATGVTQLHDEFLAAKQGRPLPPTNGMMPLSLPTSGPPTSVPIVMPTMARNNASAATAAASFGPRAMSRESSSQTATGTENPAVKAAGGMPMPAVTMGNVPVIPNPYAAAATPAAAPAAVPAPGAAGLPTMLRPGGSAPADAAPPAVAGHITFGNGGRWTNLATPNLDNGFTTPVRTAKRPQTRKWHASAPAGPRKPEEAWYRPDDAVEKPAPSPTKAEAATGKTAKQRPSPLKNSSYTSNASVGSAGSAASSTHKAGRKFVAAAGGALLVRAALKEWEKFKAQQRAEGKPEDPIPLGASGNPELDQRIPLPEPIAAKLRDATEACDQEGVTRAVRDAAQAGLGTQAIIKLTEHVERLEGDERRAAAKAEAEADDGRLDGDTLAPSEAADRSVGMPTPSPHKTRFTDIPEEIGSMGTGSSLSEDVHANTSSGGGGPSTGALALAVEEILKHLLERKEEEKKRQAQAEALKAKEAEKKKKEQATHMTTAQNKEAEKAELVEMILSRLGQEKARQKEELARQRSELDPKSAIESLVTMLNTQRESDRAIKEMASSLLRTTTEQNGKLVEAVNSAAREMLKHNINAHADELKRTLSKEVAVMFEDVGKIREVKRALEHEIADLFAIKSRHLAFDAHGNAGGGGMGLSMAMPPPIPYHAPAQIAPYNPPMLPPQQMQPLPPMQQPWMPPHAYALNPPYQPPPGQDGDAFARDAPASDSRSAPAKTTGEKSARKAAAKAAKVTETVAGTAATKKATKAAAAPAAAAAEAPAVQVARMVPAFLGGGKDILNPFSISFGPRAPR